MQTMDKLEQIKNAVTANGMREWTDERVSQAMREYADQQNSELLAWKESALSELNRLDLQSLGRKLEVGLGQSVIENVHAKIDGLLERVKELESELEHHKRDVFSLQTDLENKKWFDVYEKDLLFLREILERFEKSDRDVAQREYVEQMLKDWIAELEAK